ncbi:MAG: DEAD/DEAH box helicase [Planctomycetota bacterium]
MLVLHANWTEGGLHLWAEALDAYQNHHRAFGHADEDGSDVATLPLTRTATNLRPHPFTVGAIELRMALANCPWHSEHDLADSLSLSLRLPAVPEGPRPSDRLRSAAGMLDDVVEDPWIAGFDIEAVTIDPSRMLPVLLALRDRGPGTGVELGHAMRYWISVGTVVTQLLSAQRFIPTLVQPRDEGLRAAWLPWLHDDDAAARIGHLVAGMPPVVRAVLDRHEGHPWSILEEALSGMTDATVRSVLISDDYADALDGRDPAADPHVAWLSGLLARTDRVVPPPSVAVDLLRDTSQWVRRLDDTGRDQPLRLCLRLNAPLDAELGADEPDEVITQAEWYLSFHLVSADDPSVIYDAEQLWDTGSASSSIGGQRIDDAQELLLTTLAKASAVYPKLEEALHSETPVGIDLDTTETYEFLRDIRPVLEESGIDVRAPSWWDDPASRLGVRLQLSPLANAGAENEGGSGPTGTSMLGLQSLVRYDWQVAIGDQRLTLDEFQRLAAAKSPLVRVHGKWVELRTDDLSRAVEVLNDKPSGEMPLLEAIHMTYGAVGEEIGLPVFGLDADGWIANLLGASNDKQKLDIVEQPPEFLGTLRPYQRIGVSWLAFLDRFGMGACLADDMGLGKTIQLIALLLHERRHDANVGPTLLVVPTSVMSNWERELNRFAPNLTAHLHHGPDRPDGNGLAAIAAETDVIITTYALVTRDSEALQKIQWHRVVLDEAQYIKNPPTKQTQAIRGLSSPRRLALTGTPVENRLTELWSIMEFCNPGYLGPAGTFRRRFAIPIERHHDTKRAEQLRAFVRPLILRRLKTDPNVITDLPACVETKEYAPLTTEQAALYERTVSDMMGAVDRAEGIQRRGLVLATLVKLKQICNHPAQALREDATEAASAKTAEMRLSQRSGKCRRMMSMLEEVLAVGEKALIFTQFRQMGHLLSAMIEHDLDVEPMFLHGGTPQQKRQLMVDRFQDPNGGVPVFLLSLKAGGLGLNLTAANHVFHFDRWWNPAVENQATDRAFRIGQTRTVHVHKFVCVGTLEERIDSMIEQKTELAQNIIGAGEQWLAELTTRQLQDLLTLRATAMENEE